MERSGLEKLTPAQREALPKGDRMFLAPLDEATGKGEEIISLCKKHGVPATTAADLISVHGYAGAAALLDRTQGVLTRLEEAGDTRQALPTFADIATRTREHMVPDDPMPTVPDASREVLKQDEEVLPATVPIPDERCTWYTRVALHDEADENPSWAHVQCYLNHGHEVEEHRGWHAKTGDLRWPVLSSGNGTQT